MTYYEEKMHELSLINNLFDILEEQAKENNAGRITFVRLKVGVLSGAVPELLETAFQLYKKDTIVSDAQLEIEKVPLRLRCRRCKQEMLREDFIFACSNCHSTDLETLDGTDIWVEKVELEIE